ncbi:MAG: carbon monoxide dehydrogenase subunit G [Rhodobacteraceae bacterium]|nr:carbon monoxide dehydrogenase subunit G [Paracoccaceae bacterium]
MEMSGKIELKKHPQIIWHALNSPEVLEQCIPGCEELKQISPTHLSAIVVTKVGPVKVKFKGNIYLEKLNPPFSYEIKGEGSGGVAGFAKGSALVNLKKISTGTLLHYSVNVQVGGKLVQLGSRLIFSTANKLAKIFFNNFAEFVEKE